MAAKAGSGQGLGAWPLGKQVLRQESQADKVRCAAAGWNAARNQRRGWLDGPPLSFAAGFKDQKKAVTRALCQGAVDSADTNGPAAAGVFLRTGSGEERPRGQSDVPSFTHGVSAVWCGWRGSEPPASTRSRIITLARFLSPLCSKEQLLPSACSSGQLRTAPPPRKLGARR